MGWNYSGLELYYGRDGTDRVPEVFEQELVDATYWTYTLYAKGGIPSETIGEGEIVCWFADGRQLSTNDLVRVTYTVVDRSAEPILSRPTVILFGITTPVVRSPILRSTFVLL